MKNLRFYRVLLSIAVVASILAINLTAEGAGKGRPFTEVVIYVTSQDLCFDSIVLTDLPQKGPFQKLEMGGPTGLQTEFGPTDPGYVGGRWWVDANGNNEIDEGDAFFLCPLLGPGMECPE